ncbi:hypothetical protein Tco_0044794 [Tanacetum coccineum]
MDENQLDDVMEVVKQMNLNKQFIESENEFESDTEDAIPETTDPDAVIEEVTSKIPCDLAETVIDYKEPHVQGISIPVEGTYFDTLDEAIDMYTKYAEMGGFEVKKSGQRKTKSGVAKH